MRYVAIIAIAGLLLTGLAGLTMTDAPEPPRVETTSTHESPEGTMTLLERRASVGSRGAEFFLDGDVRVLDIQRITATATWKDSELDQYDGLQLSVRTAASRTPIVLGLLDAVEPIDMIVTHMQSDVQEMRRSAWSFIVTPIGPDPVLFSADVELTIVGQVGAPMGHAPVIAPSSPTLLEVQDTFTHRQQHVANGSGEVIVSYGAPSQVYWLDDGNRVQADRLLVTIELEPGYALDGVRLGHQAADRLGWAWQYPDARQGDTLRFFIDVAEGEQDADIQTGLWQFGLRAGTSGGNLGVLRTEQGFAHVPFTMTVKAL